MLLRDVLGPYGLGWGLRLRCLVGGRLCWSRLVNLVHVFALCTPSACSNSEFVAILDWCSTKSFHRVCVGISANGNRRCDVFDTDACYLIANFDELEIADVVGDARALVELKVSKKYG